MSDLVRNPKDWFSGVAARVVQAYSNNGKPIAVEKHAHPPTVVYWTYEI